MKVKQEVYGEESPQYAWSLYNLAFLLNNQLRFNESLIHSEQIVRQRDRTIPEEHPVISAALQMKAVSLMGGGDSVSAEELFRQSLSLRERTLAPDHWILDTSRSILGECLAQNGKTAEARDLLVQSLENLTEKLGSQHEQVKNARQRLRKFESAMH
ncbi:MAG: tetratricopeptide repeat protein [Pyrinomonadaceae bacterium]|nr:tetratricopeptide repeat protein [Pyrinomonadaceae bacterium]